MTTEQLIEERLDGLNSHYGGMFEAGDFDALFEECKKSFQQIAAKAREEAYKKGLRDGRKKEHDMLRRKAQQDDSSEAERMTIR